MDIWTDQSSICRSSTSGYCCFAMAAISRSAAAANKGKGSSRSAFIAHGVSRAVRVSAMGGRHRHRPAGQALRSAHRTGATCYRPKRTRGGNFRTDQYCLLNVRGKCRLRFISSGTMAKSCRDTCARSSQVQSFIAHRCLAIRTSSKKAGFATTPQTLISPQVQAVQGLRQLSVVTFGNTRQKGYANVCEHKQPTSARANEANFRFGRKISRRGQTQYENDRGRIQTPKAVIHAKTSPNLSSKTAHMRRWTLCNAQISEE